MLKSLNLLTVNLKKTNFVVYNRVESLANDDKNVSFNDKALLQVNEVFDLGIFLDCKIAWKHHNKLVTAEITRGLRFIRILKHVFPLSALITVYHATMNR